MWSEDVRMRESDGEVETAEWVERRNQILQGGWEVETKRVSEGKDKRRMVNLKCESEGEVNEKKGNTWGLVRLMAKFKRENEDENEAKPEGWWRTWNVRERVKAQRGRQDDTKLRSESMGEGGRHEVWHSSTFMVVAEE